MRALAFSIDNSYEMPFRVLWHSLIATESLPKATKLYFLHNTDFNPETMNQLADLVARSGHIPVFLDAERRLPDNLPIGKGDHVSPATFYRLSLSSILPPELESVVHLDLDTVAVRSIRELFTLELKYPVAAADHASPADSRRISGDKLGTYFQAGVLVIDLKLWRLGNFEKRFQEILVRKQGQLLWWDQDVLNHAFMNNWQRLPIWFNVGKSVRNLVSVAELSRSARLIHYDGNRKPWVRFSPQTYSAYWYECFEECFGFSLRQQLEREMRQTQLKAFFLSPLFLLTRTFRKLLQPLLRSTGSAR